MRVGARKLPPKQKTALSHLSRICGRCPPSSRSHSLVQIWYPLHLRRFVSLHLSKHGHSAFALVSNHTQPSVFWTAIAQDPSHHPDFRVSPAGSRRRHSILVCCVTKPCPTTPRFPPTISSVCKSSEIVSISKPTSSAEHGLGRSPALSRGA